MKKKDGTKVQHYYGIKAKDLFKSVASRANYLNKEIVEEVYSELVRVIVHELKENGEITLPNLARLYLVRHIPHKAYNVLTGQPMITSPLLMVKMRVDYKVKFLFHEFGKRPEIMKRNYPGKRAIR